MFESCPSQASAVVKARGPDNNFNRQLYLNTPRRPLQASEADIRSTGTGIVRMRADGHRHGSSRDGEDADWLCRQRAC